RARPCRRCDEGVSYGLAGRSANVSLTRACRRTRDRPVVVRIGREWHAWLSDRGPIAQVGGERGLGAIALEVHDLAAGGVVKADAVAEQDGRDVDVDLVD